jgi:glycosyltransferase involved in cell wall biosynthesis
MRGPVQAFFLLVFWWKAFLRLLSERLDVIHCHNLDVLPLGFAVSLVKKCALVFDAHEPNYYALWPRKWHYFLPLINAVERLLARRATCVIVTNEYQVRKFRHMGVRNVVLVGNYPIKEYSVSSVPRRGSHRKDVVFGRIGTIYHDVGIEEAAAAFSGIMDAYPSITLLLAGRIVEPYRREVERIVSPLGDRIRLTGAYDAPRMSELYSQIDVSLLIYRKTDWFRHITPTKFYDSLSHGVPVIMTDIGGIGDIIREHECGIVVDENDIDGIGKAMRFMITHPEERIAMAEKGLRLIRDHFNWTRMEQILQEAYAAI